MVADLNNMRSWLFTTTVPNRVKVTMTSEYKYDPRGHPAVHCAQKDQYDTAMLICVNTLRTYTEAEITVTGDRGTMWEEYYTGEPSYVAEGNLLLRFDPLEVKVLLEKK